MDRRRSCLVKVVPIFYIRQWSPVLSSLSTCTTHTSISLLRFILPITNRICSQPRPRHCHFMPPFQLPMSHYPSYHPAFNQSYFSPSFAPIQPPFILLAEWASPFPVQPSTGLLQYSEQPINDSTGALTSPAMSNPTILQPYGYPPASQSSAAATTSLVPSGKKLVKCNSLVVIQTATRRFAIFRTLLAIKTRKPSPRDDQTAVLCRRSAREDQRRPKFDRLPQGGDESC